MTSCRESYRQYILDTRIRQPIYSPISVGVYKMTRNTQYSGRNIDLLLSVLFDVTIKANKMYRCKFGQFL